MGGGLVYYLLHIPLMHLLAVVVCYARYGLVRWMFEDPLYLQPPGWGYSLPIIYLVIGARRRRRRACLWKA
jgi:hypothetical protein